MKIPGTIVRTVGGSDEDPIEKFEMAIAEAAETQNHLQELTFEKVKRLKYQGRVLSYSL